MKIEVKHLLEKGLAACKDLDRRISEVEQMISEYNPFTVVDELRFALQEAIEAEDLKAISDIGYKLYRIERNSYPLDHRRMELHRVRRDIRKVVDALNITTEHSLNFNPNRGGHGSESAAYAEILDYETGVDEREYRAQQIADGEDD